MQLEGRNVAVCAYQKHWNAVYFDAIYFHIKGHTGLPSIPYFDRVVEKQGNCATTFASEV
mgnify:CR=1 FL=1